MAEETSLEQRDAAEVETDETTDEVEQIRGKIEETRAEMSETIDAIQEKLSLSNITEQVSEQISEQASAAFKAAKDTAYTAVMGKVGEIVNLLGEAGVNMKKTKIYNQVSSNPFPFVLIGLGAGLLLLGNSKKNSSSSNGRRLNFSGKSRLKEGKNKLGEAASSAYETVGDAANSAYERVGEAANSAYKGVRQFADGTVEKAGQFGTSAQETYEQYIEEKPLAVGAIALAVGAAVGLSIPSTSYENQLMGETRANLMAKAGDVVQDTMKKVENVAGEAVKSVGNEVKKQEKT